MNKMIHGLVAVVDVAALLLGHVESLVGILVEDHGFILLGAYLGYTNGNSEGMHVLIGSAYRIGLLKQISGKRFGFGKRFDRGKVDHKYISAEAGDDHLF